MAEVPNPKVSVKLFQGENDCHIVVSDNGPGIPEDLREDIFVPFFTTKKLGTGIGLSLSRQIIKAHGGDLKLLESEVGSRFEVRLG